MPLCFQGAVQQKDNRTELKQERQSEYRRYVAPGEAGVGRKGSGVAEYLNLADEPEPEEGVCCRETL